MELCELSFSEKLFCVPTNKSNMEIEVLIIVSLISLLIYGLASKFKPSLGERLGNQKPQAVLADYPPNNHSTQEDHFIALARNFHNQISSVPVSKILSLPAEETDAKKSIEGFLRNPSPVLQDHKKCKFQMIQEPGPLLKLCQDILKNSREIGVDIENCSFRSYQGYICLIQISTEKGNFIIDALKLRSEIKANLGQIFHNPTICKIFHGGHSDVVWLQRDFDIFLVNYFDTQCFAKLLYSGQAVSLHVLWGEFCGLKMEKSEKSRFQQSNWAARPLSAEQLRYAMLDSCFLITLRDQLIRRAIEREVDYDQIQSAFNDMRAVSLRTYINEPFSVKACLMHYNKFVVRFCPDNEEQSQRKFVQLSKLRDEIARDIDEHVDYLCSNDELYNLATHRPGNIQEIEDLFRNVRRATPRLLDDEYADRVLNILRSNNSEEFLNEIRNVLAKVDTNQNKQKQRQKRKDKRKQVYVEKFSTKSPVYENCKMYAPNGELLSNCDRKKIAWYLTKGLAEKISDDPLSIRLSFEPNGRKERDHSNFDNDFYVTDRTNQCVICGAQENYLRFHIIPTLYRQNFPEEMKSHRSHDVVLLCFNCHEVANRAVDKFKKKLAEEYDVPMIMISEGLLIKSQVEQVKKNAGNLLKHSEFMPEEKKIRLQSELLGYLQALIPDNTYIRDIIGDSDSTRCSKELLTKLNKIDFKKFKKASQSQVKTRNDHGKLLTDKVDDLEGFVKRWRIHFVETHNPKFLPPNWHVDHQFQRTFGVNSKFRKDNTEEGEKQAEGDITEEVNLKKDGNEAK